VLVGGAGPSGLSTAWHLALLGHTVVIHEAGPLAGGMMHFGIPKYRLPREVLDAEIDRIRSLGVEIVLNHKVDELMVEKAVGQFDAVFLAVGGPLLCQRKVGGALRLAKKSTVFFATRNRSALVNAASRSADSDVASASSR